MPISLEFPDPERFSEPPEHPDPGPKTIGEHLIYWPTMAFVYTALAMVGVYAVGAALFYGSLIYYALM